MRTLLGLGLRGLGSLGGLGFRARGEGVSGFRDFGVHGVSGLGFGLMDSYIGFWASGLRERVSSFKVEGRNRRPYALKIPGVLDPSCKLMELVWGFRNVF